MRKMVLSYSEYGKSTTVVYLHTRRIQGPKPLVEPTYARVIEVDPERVREALASWDTEAR